MTAYPVRSSGRRSLEAFCGWCLLAGFVAGLSGCSKNDDAQGAQKPRTRPPVLVRVETVVEKELAPRVVVVGTVTAKRTSIVASGANGVVQEYHVEEGQWIDHNTVLSQLRMEASNREFAEAEATLKMREQEEIEAKTFRPEEISEAEFRMAAARFAKKNAEQKLDRAKNAFARGAVNQDDLDEAQERADMTKSLYQAAEQNYKRLFAGPRQEKQDQAKYNREAQKEHVGYLKAEQAKRTTKAPFSGYVVKEQSYVGQWLSKGDPVATIAMLDEVDVIVNVDQSDIRHIQIGKTAAVRIQGQDLIQLKTLAGERHRGVLQSESATEIEFLDDRGNSRKIARSDVVSHEILPWPGIVVQVVPKSDWQTGSRGFPVKVRVLNRFQTVAMTPKTKGGPPVKRIIPILKEGMMATVEFQGEVIDAYLVPKDALVRTTDGIKINLFEPSTDDPNKGRTLQMRVTPGIGEGLWIQVTPNPANPGEPKKLEPGMQVVTEGGERLAPVQGNVLVARKAVKSPSGSPP